MKYLKKYKLFENIQSISKIQDMCKQYGITNYTINDDLSIDVNGDVMLHSRELTKLPLKFRNIYGSFYCYGNQLTSLEGAPQSVMGHFYCSNNKLMSLEGAPQSVGGNFYCSYNKLTSLEGAPKSVGGNFSCGNNQLASLEGSPQSVGGYLNYAHNNLASLEGYPQHADGDFYCMDNPIYKIFDLFGDKSKIELFNEYDVVREVDGKPAIVLDRLNAFLEEIEKPNISKRTRLTGWIII
jgi:hypothetical protein